jgi:hypothetical protein
VHLTFDPYSVFRTSSTAAGLYARQKWLGQKPDAQWKAAFQQCVDGLIAGQSPDGSWNRSEIETIRRLFGLHLTVRTPDRRILAAMDWLMDRLPDAPLLLRDNSTPELSPQELRGLPFVPAPRAEVAAAATLFLACIFDQRSDARIISAYEAVVQEGVETKGALGSTAAACNMFRALVVHPAFANDICTTLIVEHLADQQLAGGDWPDPIPFYQTVNALAHVDLPAADSQLEKAWQRLAETQNADGTWGKDQPEWNTFLVVHAMRRKSVLSV